MYTNALVRNSLSWNTTKKGHGRAAGSSFFYNLYLGWLSSGRLGGGGGGGVGLGIHKFTEGYLYFRKYRYAGYAILRDTHISVTLVSKGILSPLPVVPPDILT